MAFTILPPNTPIIDSRGALSPEWYRFFAAVQRVVGSDLVEELQQARYVTWAAETILPNDRLLAAGAGLDLTLDASNASLSLENTAVAPGVYGSAAKTVAFTVDQQGRLTNAAEYALSTTSIAEGTNLYFTDTRARAAISVSGSLAYDSGTGVISYTTPNSDGITEGATNLYYTDARARASLSAGAGITYNSGTGVIAVTKTLDEGTYTPTLTNGANVDASTAFLCHYSRVGNQVHCWGQINIDPTAAANTLTQVDMSLPIASNFSAGTDLRGVGAAHDVQRAAFIDPDTTNDRARFRFFSEVTGNTTFSFAFDYEII